MIKKLLFLLVGVIFIHVNAGTPPSCPSSNIFFTCSSLTFDWDYPSDAATMLYSASQTVTDQIASITMPFDFYFYGAKYTTIQGAINGWVGFGSPYATTPSYVSPSPSTYPIHVAAYWQPMQFTGGYSNFTTDTYGTAPSRRFVITWNNFVVQGKDFPPPISGFTFQVKLFETTNVVEVHYKNITASDDMTAYPTVVEFINEASTYGAVLYNGTDFAVQNAWSQTAWRLTPKADISPIFNCPTGDPIYTCSKISSNLEDISAGTAWNPGSDLLNISLPFDFTFYADTYNAVTLSVNGWIGFGSTLLIQSDAVRIPNPTAPNGIIAGYTGLLTPGTTMARYHTLGTAPNRRFVVSWPDWRFWAPMQNTTSLNFQIKIYETTNVVEIHFGDLQAQTFFPFTKMASALAGIENEQGTVGMAAYQGWAYPGYFNHTAYRYTPTTTYAPTPSPSTTPSPSPQALLNCPSSQFYSCSFGTSNIEPAANLFKSSSGAFYDMCAITDLGFSFTYFRTYTTSSVAVSSNGWVSVIPHNYSAVSNAQDMPAVGYPEGVIAPFWTYLKFSSNQLWRFDTLGTQPNRRFVVSWLSTSVFYNTTVNVTMQAKLFESTNTIEFHYETMNFIYTDGKAYTVGLENQYGNQAVLLMRNMPQNLSGKSITFTVISPSPTPTPSVTPSASSSPTPTKTPSPSVTPTASLTPTPSMTPSTTPSPSVTPSGTPILPQKLVVKIEAHVNDTETLNVPRIHTNIAEQLNVNDDGVNLYVKVANNKKKQQPNVYCEVSFKNDHNGELADKLVNIAETQPEKIFGEDSGVTSVTASTFWRGPKLKEDDNGLTRDEVIVVAVLCTVIPAIVIVAVVAFVIHKKKQDHKIRPIELQETR